MTPDEALNLLTVDDVCRLLKVRRSWVYDAVDRGHLSAVRLGRQVRFRHTELARFVESLTPSGIIARTDA